MPSNYDDQVNGTESSEGGSLADKMKRKRHLVSDAFKIRKDNGWDEKFVEFIKLYSNQYPWDELADYKDIVIPNMIFSTVSVIVPSISINNPKITVTAKQIEEVHQAELSQAVVNHYWRELDVQDQVREAVKDMVIVGHGWIKVTWETEKAERDLDPQEWQEQAIAAVDQLNQAKSGSPLGDDEFPSVDEVVNAVPRTVEEVVKDVPRVNRVSPFDIIVDPDALRLQDARWIAQKSYIPLATARKKTEWNAKARRKLRASTLSEIRDGIDVTDDDDTTREPGFVCVYEYYDLLDGTVCTFAERGEGFLVNPEKSPFPDVHPYVFLANHEVPERFFPIGDVELIYALQLELGMVRTQMTNDRKAGRRIYLYREESLTSEGVDALESDIDRVMLNVIDDRPFSEVFQSVQSQGLHPEWYASSEQIINDINMISGVSEYSRGQMPDIRRTATEAGLIQDASNSRAADKLFRTEQAMARIAERMIKLSQQFLDGEDVAKIVNDDQAVMWVQFNRTAIQGDFTFEVEAGSSQPQNESFRRQSALQMMDAFSSLLGTGYLNDQEFMAHILKNGFGVTNPETMLGPGPMMPPGAEEQGAPAQPSGPAG